jgi:hypothetical protein
MRHLLFTLLVLCAIPAFAQYGPAGNPSNSAGIGFQPLAKTSWVAASGTSASIAIANSATISGVAIAGNAGQFSCTCSGLAFGMTMTISGTYGGTGSIAGYSNPTTYAVIAVGSGTFQLMNLNGTALVTTTGTPSGLTYIANATSSSKQVQVYNSTAQAAFVIACLTSSCTASVGSAGTSTTDYPVAPGAVIVMTIPTNSTYVAVILTSGTGAVYFSYGVGL